MRTPSWSRLGKVFTDEAAARELLEQMRWPNGPVCPHCGESNPYVLTPKATSTSPGRQGLYKCRAKECRKQYTVTVGTVFESSHIPVTKWIQAIYLQSASKKGISALQLQRMLGFGSYKTAWFMAHRLRHAMSLEPLASKLGGKGQIVEADETYVGGKRRLALYEKAGKKDHKTPVVALVERGGRVRAMPMERVTVDTLADALNEHVDPASVIHTDENIAYKKATRGFKAHRFVTHGRHEYARNGVTSNSAEGFFSLLKRGLHGTYHHCGKGHLAKYCDEFAFKYSTRKVTDAERAGMIVQGAEGKRLTYENPDQASRN